MDRITRVSVAVEGFEITIETERDKPGDTCYIRKLVPLSDVGELTCLAICPGDIGTLRQLLVHIEQLYSHS